MPFAVNNDIRLYYETEGNGPPLLFTHGLGSTHQMWREYGYVDQLKDDFTTIIYDQRGHGQSDKPHEPQAYDYRLMAGDALAVLDALHIERSHFWGYSLGGSVGFGLAELAPQRFCSMILGGTGPEPGPNPPSEMYLLIRKGVQNGADAVVEGMREMFGEVSPGYEARLRSMDYEALAALLEQWEFHPHDFAAVPPTMAMPCLVYVTADDGIAETQAWVAQMPNATFFALDGNHLNSDAEQEMSKCKAFLAQVREQQ